MPVGWQINTVKMAVLQKCSTDLTQSLSIFKTTPASQTQQKQPKISYGITRGKANPDQKELC